MPVTTKERLTKRYSERTALGIESQSRSWVDVYYLECFLGWEPLLWFGQLVGNQTGWSKWEEKEDCCGPVDNR
jgi:hypothetical protein